MAQDGDLASTVQELMDSPGGKMLQNAKEHLRSRLNFLAIVFIFGLVLGFTFTKAVISYLIDPVRLPADVYIIVISPVELILLQLRIAASLGLFLVVLTLLVDGGHKAAKNEFVRQRFSELNIKPPQSTSTVLVILLTGLVLAVGGFLYAWEFLIPILLDYLTTDAHSAGLTTEWRLSGYVGFITTLVVASMVGFQSPLATLIILRLELAQREDVKRYRKHIWFVAFVLGAFLSPPDPLSLFLVAMPVIVLFELALLYDKIFSKN